MANDLIPSWLTSWVAWRNFYTEPGEEPFYPLKKELNLNRMPSSSEFIYANGGECPYCRDDSVINNTKLGLVYCLCKVLDKTQKVEDKHKEVRTVVGKSKLSEIEYPTEMGGEYRRTMSEFVQAANTFIMSPDNWMFVSGYFGTGKSHVLKAINSAFYPMALYVSARDLEQMTHKFRKEDSLDFFYETLIGAPILILDDIGMEYGGPLVKSIIEKVVDSRYERWPDFPLIVASNMREEEFQGYIPRASDRLFDKARTQVFQIKTIKSYRKVHPGMRQ
jgi:DNA replication protein DnaC